MRRDIDHKRDEHSNGEPGYEASDWSLVLLTSLAVGFLLLIVAGMGTVHGVDRFFSGEQAELSRVRAVADPESPLASLAGFVTSIPPGPRYTAAPAEELNAYRRTQVERLGTYDLKGRPPGRGRIPVDRAMELIATRGLPSFSNRFGSHDQANVVPVEGPDSDKGGVRP